MLRLLRKRLRRRPVQLRALGSFRLRGRQRTADTLRTLHLLRRLSLRDALYTLGLLRLESAPGGFGTLRHTIGLL